MAWECADERVAARFGWGIEDQFRGASGLDEWGGMQDFIRRWDVFFGQTVGLGGQLIREQAYLFFGVGSHDDQVMNH